VTELWEAAPSGLINVSALTVPETRVDSHITDADDTLLLKSMVAVGQRLPIVLGPTNTVLFGGRRVAAATQLGWKQIQFLRAQNVASAVQLWKHEQDELGLYPHAQLSPGDLMRMCLRIEALPLSVPGSKRNALLSEAIGMSTSAYFRLKKSVVTADGEPYPEDVDPVKTRKAAQDGLAQLAFNDGAVTVTGVYEHMRAVAEGKRRSYDPKTARHVTEAQPLPPKTANNSVKELINRSISTLTGVTIALDGLTPEEVATLPSQDYKKIKRDFNQLAIKINRTNRILKENDKP
jgi:hypothetical protein